MEPQTYGNPLMFGLVACTALFVLFVLWFRKEDDSSKKQKLPPGSAGWPIIGENLQFFRSVNSPQPRGFLDEHERKYGPIFRCSLLGTSRNVVSVDPEFNKFAYQNEGRLFKSNYPYSTRKLLGKYGLLQLHGDLQRKLHAMTANLMRYEALATEYLDDIQDIYLAGLKKWEDERDICLQPKCNQLVLSLMGRKLLSLPAADDIEEIYEAFYHFVEAIVVVPINIPGTLFYKGLKARQFIVEKIQEIIEERRRHPEVVHNDVLNKMMKDGTFSDEIMRDMILSLLFAGYETSSTAMAYAIRYLSENPPALEELRAEHDALVKAKGGQKLTMDDYQSMKFTHSVINETLRLSNVAPVSFREAKQDIKVKDFVIPKGWNVFVYTTGTHQDEKHHSQPLKFDPWRWQKEGQEAWDKSPTFMPFGGGARHCPGYHLARLEMALFLHDFLTKFTWEAAEDGGFTYFPLPKMTKGFPIRLHPRPSAE